MNISKPTMSEDAARFWTALFALLTTFGVIGGGIYSVLQYLKTYQLQVEVAQFEAKKPFYAQYLELCSEASSAAATIATTSDREKKLQATDDFWRLYWGPLATVEDKGVEGAMVEFGKCVKRRSEGCSLPTLSLDLAKNCRAGMSASWQVTLQTLQNRTED